MGHPKILLFLHHLQGENSNLIVILAYPGQQLPPIQGTQLHRDGA